MEKIRKLDNASCPICGIKMENGYIYSDRRIKWADNNNPKYFTIGDETLVGIEMSFKLKKLVAYRCIYCKIVTFQYES
ncbi:hypothetical protein Desor_2228 [Desulfosporosinus orientis DSM 765]|uniref:DUF6487 domain-containing protein n=1 Tax=Desulfosporosinus orientis (strain ATCC 19365 / DSM 765 / NCIMB 8382 / VKM B-1628 / Singapore I) TaxID=768706 RepID=G7WB49_DESOD|nr:PF20097 family protein [Desulfosporosinus orientis]AET67830.1 hypothetical protein Desor_2228 [Desulfosporosinus orientis DSM 765]